MDKKEGKRDRCSFLALLKARNSQSLSMMAVDAIILRRDQTFVRSQDANSGKCHLPLTAFEKLNIGLGDCLEVTIQEEVLQPLIPISDF
jgi:hypothetical protein